MLLPGVNLHFPQTLQEALQLLDELEDARIIAGGTDLLVDMKQGLVKAGNLISLQRVKTLKAIVSKGGRIFIGAMVTPQEISTHPLIFKNFPAFAEAARSMASSQIRSMATIGGNIASAVPSADLPPLLIAMEASLSLQCSGGSREIALDDFFAGPRDTVCGAGEILTGVSVPLPHPNTGISYQKMTLRDANALAVASVASSLTLSHGVISRARIVLGAVAPTPLLASEPSDSLLGEKPSEKLFQQTAIMAQEASRPISDVRGSIWFRKELVRVLTHRALKDSLKRVKPDGQGGI